MGSHPRRPLEESAAVLMAAIWSANTPVALGFVSIKSFAPIAAASAQSTP